MSDQTDPPKVAPSPPELVELTPPERSRTYHHVNFPGGKLTLKFVTHFLAKPSGTHRLQTNDGKKWIVDPAKGFAIELDVDAWTL